jgi:hypothetical protein
LFSKKSGSFGISGVDALSTVNPRDPKKLWCYHAADEAQNHFIRLRIGEWSGVESGAFG